jgi:hypothetical protein
LQPENWPEKVPKGCSQKIPSLVMKQGKSNVEIPEANLNKIIDPQEFTGN